MTEEAPKKYTTVTIVLEGHVDVFGRTEEIHYGHHSVHEAGKGAGK